MAREERRQRLRRLDVIDDAAARARTPSTTRMITRDRDAALISGLPRWHPHPGPRPVRRGSRPGCPVLAMFGTAVPAPATTPRPATAQHQPPVGATGSARHRGPATDHHYKPAPAMPPPGSAYHSSMQPRCGRSASPRAAKANRQRCHVPSLRLAVLDTPDPPICAQLSAFRGPASLAPNRLICTPAWPASNRRVASLCRHRQPAPAAPARTGR